MKKILIISPLFAPVNAADMHRIRSSLPYFKKFGWEVTLVTVAEKYVDMVKDNWLLKSIPNEITIHKIPAFPKEFTVKFGLGSVALRSFWQYKQKVNQLLKEQHFDLIYFSTTQFPLLVLGAYWKKKFNIPYIIDMQDPWHTDYYQDKPKIEQPKKYWFSYRLNKYLEPIAMKNVDGIISVSKGYIDTLKQRYGNVITIPTKVIPFGFYKNDFDVVKANPNSFRLNYTKAHDTFNFVYIGRGGADMKAAVNLLFGAFKKGLEQQFQLFKKFRFHFIGTSYAPNGQGKASILPIAENFGISDYITEKTDRIPFYDTIYNLINADALLVIGADDKNYTASKIYPYALAEKPLLAIFHEESSAFKIIKECNLGKVFSISTANEIDIYDYLIDIVNDRLSLKPDWAAFEKYSALNLTKQQCDLFDTIYKLNNNRFEIKNYFNT